MSLKTPESIRKLQRKLYCKAKAEPSPSDSVAMNQVGEPDAGNPDVRFDERRLETEFKPPRQSSTLLKNDLFNVTTAGLKVKNAVFAFKNSLFDPLN